MTLETATAGVNVQPVPCLLNHTVWNKNSVLQIEYRGNRNYHSGTESLASQEGKPPYTHKLLGLW